MLLHVISPPPEVLMNEQSVVLLKQSQADVLECIAEDRHSRTEKSDTLRSLDADQGHPRLVLEPSHHHYAVFFLSDTEWFLLFPDIVPADNHNAPAPLLQLLAVT